MFVVIDDVKIVLTTNVIATILQACEFVGYNVLRFCFHRKLALVGSCRVCLCDVVRERKPVPACVTQLRDAMVINFLTASVKKLREDILMFILFNHPLDCPTCDQGGSCELQDFAFVFGTSKSRYFYFKHSFENLNRGPIVKTIMSRCIHCTRCVRFLRDTSGFNLWGTVGRGCHMEIGNYVKSFLNSEMSGNIIDLCPVGALTQKPYAFTFRPWDVTSKRSLDFTDSCGTNILINCRGSFIYKILPYLNDDLNEEWISDRARFIFDGLYIQRISSPLIKRGGFNAVSWETMLLTLRNLILHKVVSTTNCGIILGSLRDCESFLAIKKFFNKFGISNFYNTVSRNTLSAQYLLNSSISDLENYEFCCCVGLCLKQELTVLNLRLRRCVVDKNMLCFYIGANFPTSFAVYLLGASVRSLISICSGKSKICSVVCKVSSGLFLFNAKLLNISWIGSCFDMLKMSCNKRKGLFNVSAVSTYGNVVGQNEINFNLKNKKDINMLTYFILFGCQEFELKSMMPNLINKFICYFGDKFNKVALLSQYIIPTTSLFERNGTYINLEGRSQKAVKIFKLAGLNRAEWQILVNICLFLETSLGFMKFGELAKTCVLYSPLLHNSKPCISIFKNLEIIVSKYTMILLNGSFIPYIYNFYLVEDYSKDSFVMQQCNALFGNACNFVL